MAVPDTQGPDMTQQPDLRDSDPPDSDTQDPGAQGPGTQGSDAQGSGTGGAGRQTSPAQRVPRGRAGRIRVVVAKPGLDGHDRGAKVVARALRDAGMEVVYTGLHQTPEQIVETAIQEDADGIGLSVLSGAHMTLFRRVMDLLRQRGADDIVVFGGGIIPNSDIQALADMGVAMVFTPGTPTHEIVAWVRDHLGEPAEPADAESV